MQAQSDGTESLHRRLTDCACLLRVVLYPLDTIKTRLQTATSQKSMKAFWKGGGNKALYKGLMGNLAGVHSSPMMCRCAAKSVQHQHHLRVLWHINTVAGRCAVSWVCHGEKVDHRCPPCVCHFHGGV